MKRFLISFLLLILVSPLLRAQDTLPRFSLKNVGSNRIVVGWTNPYDTSIRQISIQRSFDSLKNFRTILTVPDPTTLQNGYVDTKASTDHMFYRLYILLEKGNYLFSESKRPVKDTISAVITQAQPGFQDVANPNFAKPGNNRFTPNMIGGDSIAGPIISNTNNRPKSDLFVPSKLVYTFPDGYVKISLPDKERKKYRIRFLTMDDKLLFEIKEPKEREFKIDKTNFYKSGWYKFEIYEDDDLLEKHRFYLPKEF
ncbi:MAG: hypothetical protein EOO05_07685 [Chitinophagaceae bacterium]|nr:MAG: hypothetical protein EOO05_07685 [Chitinophagaceae bacterium]